MLSLGQQAPAFTAESTQGQVRLGDSLGKRPIVLIFYPKDDTPICTRQLCAVRDSKARYAAYDALVLGINPGTLDEHRRFSAKHHYDFPLVSDPDQAIRQKYDVGETLFGLLGQQRIVYVIDRQGKIVYARKGNRPTDEIVAALKSACAPRG
ncbi:peroxiredoxin [Paenibacillus hamazuiensis]|uniref:peroxiredoxin n=1 Tax=Paenibacillus hamazuiensis TaxID=2936508 RepID=UPI00200EF468|nr:peroxiredoxin [Paenibacillus hamazuiensis]